ncbi:carbohydrate ABC transporter permease [Paenibacillaceae bacterium WGS1546]|uniref:carbohydrate ABC transporter permease n=1 Tax=Cohnella sp. WGS1546 TaxID=3366810 RepID=UPI00372D6CE2
MIKDTTPGARLFDGVLIAVLCLITLSCMLPLWYTLVLSVSSSAAASVNQIGLWPQEINFSAYRELLSESQFFRSFWISAQRVALGASLNFMVVALMAYPLSKSAAHLPGRNFIMWTLVFTMLFNGGLVPLYLTVKSLGLMNSIWALVLTTGAQGLVFNIILTVNYFRNLPKELEEAALVDGAGPWRMLFGLYIPIAVPVLATITLFSIVLHWNEFLNGLIFMTRQTYYPLQTYIQQVVVVVDAATLTEDQYVRMSSLSNRTLNAAKIFVAMIPVLLVYPFLQRFFIHGITLGSVKE